MLSAVAAFLSPYQFSPTVALVCGFAMACYAAGWTRQRATGHGPALWRALAWIAGLLLIYTALQTRLDYWSQHIFFVHRGQHLILHHLGPFLIALSAPWVTLRAGLPRVARLHILAPLQRNRPMRVLYYTVQQPVIAAILFVGLIALWLIPSIHFVAMLNNRLYNVMNWSMAIDGLLFWWLMLDPRPPAGGRRPVPAGYITRVVVLVGVMFPQILVGAIIGLSRTDLYPVYAVCGRIWPVSPLTDQHLGGLITWIPAAMMSVLGVVVVLRHASHHTRQAERPNGDLLAAADTHTTHG